MSTVVLPYIAVRSFLSHFVPNSKSFVRFSLRLKGAQNGDSCSGRGLPHMTSALVGRRRVAKKQTKERGVAWILYRYYEVNVNIRLVTESVAVSPLESEVYVSFLIPSINEVRQEGRGERGSKICLLTSDKEAPKAPLSLPRVCTYMTIDHDFLEHARAHA